MDWDNVDKVFCLSVKYIILSDYKGIWIRDFLIIGLMFIIIVLCVLFYLI